MPSIGIIVALPAEARSLVRQRLWFDSVHEMADGHWLAVAGAGPEPARAAAAKLVDREVDGLVSWGCAAGLARHLAPGHLVMAEHVVGENGRQHFTDTHWRERLSSRLSPEVTRHVAPIRESRDVVSTRRDKAHLHHISGHVALDMESAAIGCVAQDQGLPFLVVRAIADHADMDFPRAVTRALNPRGDVRMTTLLGQLALHPAELGALMALGRAFGAAMKTLHQVRRAAGADFGFMPEMGRKAYPVSL